MTDMGRNQPLNLAGLDTTDADEQKNQMHFDNTSDFPSLFRQWIDLLSRYRHIIRNKNAE